MKNTIVTYFYRDACNYKAATHLILNGTLSKQQISNILAACQYDGEDFTFVPEAIGLPLIRTGSYNEDDHPWAYFTKDAAAHFSETERPQDADMTPDEFTKRFTETKRSWEDLAEAMDQSNRVPTANNVTASDQKVYDVATSIVSGQLIESGLPYNMPPKDKNYHIAAYVGHIAAAILLSEDMLLNMSVADIHKFVAMAVDVNTLTTGLGEPRFSLFDYLDAIIYTTDLPDWRSFADTVAATLNGSDSTATASLADELVDMAEQKRCTYEGDF